MLRAAAGTLKRAEYERLASTLAEGIGHNARKLWVEATIESIGAEMALVRELCRVLDLGKADKLPIISPRECWQRLG